MSKILTREEALQLDVEVYNAAVDYQWQFDRVKNNLSGDLSVCKHCGRKYVICCICDEAEESWKLMLEEVRAISEANNNSNDEF